MANAVMSNKAPLPQPDENRESVSSIQRMVEDGEAIQRMAEDEEICPACQQDVLQRSLEEEAIQRKGDGKPNVSAATAATVSNPGPGSPLPGAIRHRIEPHLGANLSGVRVHKDRRSHAAAASLQARAFTHGNHIFLNRSESSHNLGLMAHESTHVVQQTKHSGFGLQPSLIQRREESDASVPATTAPRNGPAQASSSSSGGASSASATSQASAPPVATVEPVTREREDRPAGEVAAPAGGDLAASGAPADGSAAPGAVPTLGSARPDISIAMPEPPSEMSPAAQGRLEQVQQRTNRAASATTELPAAESNVEGARSAVTEPEEETQARAGEALVEALGERPQPSPEIDELCENIRRIIREKRPPDEESLVEADPEEAANEAGNQLNQSIEGDVERVEGSYNQLDETPQGEPAQEPTVIENPPAQVETPNIGAANAIPDPVAPEAVSLDADVENSAAQIEGAGLNTEPARLAAGGDPGGPISEAQTAQGELSETAQRAPAEVLAEQQQSLDAASADMAALQATALEALATSRARTVTGTEGQQTAMVGSEQQMRAQVGRRAEELFRTAQQQVNTLLTPLQQNAMNKWEQGKALLTSQFRQRLDRVERWVEQEYGGVIGSIVQFVAGLPDWVTEEYDAAEKDFGDGVCALIREISTEVNSVVMACEEIIDNARQEINALFDNLPEELQGWAEEQRSQFSERLDGLQNQVTEAQQNLTQGLVERAAQSVQEVRQEIHALREAAKGLLGRIADAVNAFLEDPAKFIIEGLLSLLGIAPAAFWAVVNKIDQAINDIADDPENFTNNLLSAIGQGFQQFFDNFAEHMLNGLLEWLFSGLGSVGVQIPTDFSLSSIITFFLQLMGISWERIRRLLAKHIGEENVALIEKAYELIANLIEMGPEGIFEMIKEQLNPQSILDQVLEAAVDFLIEALIKAVSIRVIALFNPVGAIVQAIEAIYKVLKWIFENAARIFSLVETVVNGISDIIAGNVSGMATAVQQALARLIAPVVDFLAGFLGIGDLPDKIADTIKGFQDWIEGILDRVIGWLAERAKALLRSLGIGGEEEDPETIDPTDHTAIATRAASELKETEGAPDNYEALRSQKEQQARQIEERYTSLLESGIKLSIGFEEVTSDRTDNAIDFEVVIGPNTTNHKDEIQLATGDVVLVWIVDEKTIRVQLDPDDPKYFTELKRGASPTKILQDVMGIEDLDLDKNAAQAFIDRLNSLGLLKTDQARSLLISFAQSGPGDPLEYLRNNLKLGRASRAARTIPTGANRNFLVDRGPTSEGEQRETLSSYASVFWESQVGQFVSRQIQKDPTQGGISAIEFVYEGSGQPQVRNLGIVRVGDDGSIVEIIQITGEIGSVDEFIELMQKQTPPWKVNLE